MAKQKQKKYAEITKKASHLENSNKISKSIDFNNRYTLYQAAVQDPPSDVELYEQMFSELLGRSPHSVREDFCAGFAFSCEWVRRNKKNTALCLDIDPEPLTYGKKFNYSRLNTEEKSRIKVLKKNVISKTSPLSDLIVAGNFSFYYLKERNVILEYFRHARASLKKDGLLFLETPPTSGHSKSVLQATPGVAAVLKSS
jgi:hypothetical protein